MLWFPFVVVQRYNVQKGNKYEIMIIVKNELLMKNEIPIMDGIAKIKRCKSSNIWQFSMWIKKEKKYYRATTGTRNTEQAIEIAQTETAKLIYRSETKKEKIFGITVSEGIAEFLDWKRRQIATKLILPQRLQTIISHLAHFEKYLDGQFKVNEIPKTILRNNIVDGVEKNYIEYRIGRKVFDDVICAYKVNGRIIEPKRTSYEKIYSDLIRCVGASFGTSVCFIDDRVHEAMRHPRVDYIHVKPYHTKFNKNDAIRRLYSSKIPYSNINRTNNILTNQYNKTRREEEIDNEITQQMFLHLTKYVLRDDNF